MAASLALLSDKYINGTFHSYYKPTTPTRSLVIQPCKSSTTFELTPSMVAQSPYLSFLVECDDSAICTVPFEEDVLTVTIYYLKWFSTLSEQDQLQRSERNQHRKKRHKVAPNIVQEFTTVPEYVVASVMLDDSKLRMDAFKLAHHLQLISFMELLFRVEAIKIVKKQVAVIKVHQ